MSNTIQHGVNAKPGTEAHFINELQTRIARLRNGESPEKVLDDKIELEVFHDLGKDRYIERLQEAIEYEKTRDHW